ncbi:MAG: insulinase family protein [Eggerthellaceae bacterium]|nr:insulinase family protein [Eggerthellaceae bacterium]
MTYRKTVLDNGITVVTDAMSGVRSITIGLWFKVGSCDERPDQAGLTHFMEHMMFKGTPTRSAFDISSEFDALGAELNAFTGREYTCYYARAVDEKMPQALEILADMVMNSEFSDETIEPEREVVIEEIARTEDQPDDIVFDLFNLAILPDHPLGLPVLGTREHVSGYQHQNCAEFHECHYHGGNMTVAVAGNVDHDVLIELCESTFSPMRPGTRSVRNIQEPKTREFLRVQQKETEQAHIVYGVPYIAFDDDRRFAGAVMSSMLGGSMSSRLFQEVREKHGLVYSIFTHPSLYQGLGALSIYAGTRPENIDRVVEITRAELRKMAMEGTDEGELSKTVESICGQLLLGLESTSTRMVRIGRGETMGMPFQEPEQIVERYRNITCDDVQQVAQEFLLQDPTFSVVSPYSEDRVRQLVGL